MNIFKIFSPVIILKITSKIVLDIRECKAILWEDFIGLHAKLVSMRREKERQLHYRFINSINLFNTVT